MNIDQLPYIIAIASAGNLSAAAKQLNVTQQALSKYLRELEAETGLDLFFRSKRQYIPTPAGKMYIQTAQSILELIQHTRNSLSVLHHQETTPFHVGVSPSRGMADFERIYPAFEKRFPQIQLSITESYSRQLQKLLLRGELDAMISQRSTDLPPEIQSLSLLSEELVLAVPSFHPLAGHGIHRFADLPFADITDFADSAFLLPQPTSVLHEPTQRFLEEAGFTPQLTSYAPNTRLAMSLIRSGTRTSMFPAHFIVNDPDISFFRLKNAPLITLAYLTRSGHVYSEAERCLIYLLVSLHMNIEESTILWSEPLHSIVSEFQNAEILFQKPEVPNGY